jgi:hypothetical protein
VRVRVPAADAMEHHNQTINHSSIHEGSMVETASLL